MSDGRIVRAELVKLGIDDELAGNSGSPAKKPAAKLFKSMMTRPDFEEFLTTVAYEYIV